MKTIQFPKSEIQFFFKELLQEPEIMVLTKKINVVRTSVLKPVRFQTLENQGKYKNLQKENLFKNWTGSSKLHKNWNQWLLWRWDPPPNTGLNLSLLVIFIFFVV